MACSSCYVSVNSTLEVKNLLKLGNWLPGYKPLSSARFELFSGLFSWIPQEIGYIFQALLKFRLSLFSLLLIGSVGQKMVGQRTRILVMQDSYNTQIQDLELRNISNLVSIPQTEAGLHYVSGESSHSRHHLKDSGKEWRLKLSLPKTKFISSLFIQNYFFFCPTLIPFTHVRVELWRKLSAKELMLLNCGVGEDSWESLGLQGDPTSPS